MNNSMEPLWWWVGISTLLCLTSLSCTRENIQSLKDDQLIDSVYSLIKKGKLNSLDTVWIQGHGYWYISNDYDVKIYEIEK